MDMLRGGFMPGLLGNGSGLVADSPSTGGYDPAAEAIFAAFTTPPIASRKITIDTCVRALKAAGVWTALDGLYLFAAADAQAAKINWINPGAYNATEINAPSFTADQGFLGASTKYLDSDFNLSTAPSPHHVQNSATQFGWSLTSGTTSGPLIGSSARNFVQPRSAADKYNITVNGNGTGFTQANNTDGLGLYSVSRTASGTLVGYRNAVSQTFTPSGSIVSAAPVSENLTFLKYAANYFVGTIAAGGYGAQLDAAAHLALYNALAAYLADLAETPATESEAIFAAFTTPPTEARQDLIDATVVSLKAAGVWTKLDALYVFAAADAQAAKINWKAPGTFTAIEVNAPVFTADQGFTGAGTKYLDTVFNATTAPTPQFVRDSAHISAWSLTDIAAGLFGIAGYVTSGALQIQPKTTGGVTASWIINAATAATAAVTDSIGLYTAVRTGATAHELYKNGASIGTGTQGSAAVVSENICFLRRTTGYFLGVIAAGGVGSQLSAAENTALYNALRTYLTGVGVP